MSPALVFDLDGTLVDSLPGIAAALNDALREHDLPRHPEAKIRGFVGSGAFLLCRRAIPKEATDDLARDVLRSFKQHYARCWPEGSAIYPGIDAMLRRLHSIGARMAVLSNKPDGFTREMVDRLFPDRLFDLVRGQRDGSPRKPDPAAVAPVLEAWSIPAGRLRFIGDSAVDRETADAAGIPFLGVAWGYQPAEVLGPRVAGSVAELEAALVGN